MVNHYLDTSIKAAIEAGNILKEGFGKNFEINSKSGINDLVTEYDLASEKCIIDILKHEYPSHSILAEESGVTDNPDSDYKWVIDPLDGTVNYAHNIPVFSVSIALEYKGEIICGVVYNPIVNEMFSASKGGGAFMNDKKIEVSESSDIQTSLLVTGFPYDIHKYKCHCVELFVKIVQSGIPIRRMGSAALDLAYVAAGRFDGFWEIGLNPWDVAAGYLILSEAGGNVTQFDGKEYDIYCKNILGTNGKIHNDVSALLHHCGKQ